MVNSGHEKFLIPLIYEGKPSTLGKTAASEAAADYQRVIHASAQLHIQPLSDKLFQNFQLFHRLSIRFRQLSVVVFSQGQQPFGIHASAFVILLVLPCRLNLMVNCCVLNASLSGGQEGGDACLRVI